jgi:hypothetical protein
MANLVKIIGSNATIRAGHAESLAAAFGELHSASGIAPVVLNAQEAPDGISGGSRNLAEASAAGAGAASDHYEDNVLGRSAVDIDNREAIQNVIGIDRFKAIMAKFGWHNIDLSGADFGREPWHYATHEPEAGSAAPASVPVGDVIGNTTGSPVYRVGADFEFWVPDAALQARIQTALKARGRYDGPEDGEWGANSVKGIQTTVANVKYSGPIDGDAGRQTAYFVQVYGQRFGDYSGPLDAFVGPNSWAAFALGLERP